MRRIMTLVLALFATIIHLPCQHQFPLKLSSQCWAYYFPWYEPERLESGTYVRPAANTLQRRRRC